VTLPVLEAAVRARPLVVLALLLHCASRPAAAQEATATDSAAVAEAGSSARTLGWIATLVPIGIGAAAMLSGEDAVGWGYVIASSGVILGPSVANWSVGQTGRGFVGMFVRMGISWGGLAVAASTCFDDCSNEATGIFLATQAVALGLAIWEVATIKNRVIRERGGTISVSPTFSPATRSIGFAARVRF
jgi:hypothetical protein